MVEERIQELSEELERLVAQRRAGESPGLLEAISRTEKKLANFREARDLWRVVLRVYPNYGR